jgi:hypothetical protein
MAASSGANKGDLDALVNKMRGKGLSDTEIVEGLTGMGYTKAQAQTAVGSGSTPTPTAPKKPQSPAGTGDEPPGPGGPTGPTLASSLTSALPSPSSLTLTPPRRLNGGDLAGFLGGMVLFTLGINFLAYGPSGVKGWFSAKFLNRVTVGAPKAGAWGQQSLTTAGTGRVGTVTVSGSGRRSGGLTSTRARSPKEA